MTGTIDLINPIMINDKTVKSLTYDTNEITAGMFARANAAKSSASGSAVSISGAFELDFSLHLYLGFMAVVAVNEEYDVADLERVKGPDVVAITRVGRNFISGKSEETSQQNSSDDTSENTPAPSTPLSEK